MEFASRTIPKKPRVTRILKRKKQTMKRNICFQLQKYIQGYENRKLKVIQNYIKFKMY